MKWLRDGSGWVATEGEHRYRIKEESDLVLANGVPPSLPVRLRLLEDFQVFYHKAGHAQADDAILDLRAHLEGRVTPA